MASSYPPALPHGPVREVLPGVHLVTGTMRFGMGFSIPRNMTILKSGDTLTLVNSVRLSPEGEAALDALGRVTDVVRLGGFHGMDDPYYKARYQPKMWAPGGLEGYDTFGEGHSPVGEGYAFQAINCAEAVLLAPGGLLITCDAFQNWTKPTFDGCSFLGRQFMRVAGFGPSFVGKFWLKRAGAGAERDLRHVAELPFERVIAGHGEPIQRDGQAELRRAISAAFQA